MRLMTRSDFDGLACAVLLVEAGIVDDFEFTHPKELQDGKVAVGPNDVLANVPFVPGCGLWFDHHYSERERLALLQQHEFKGESRITQSCARIIYEYFGSEKTFAKFDENGMMEAVDRCDSGQLTVQEILDPEGWILLSFLMDPRTGLGYHRDYRISNRALMLDLIQYCRVFSPEHILQLPDVAERVVRYTAQDQEYQQMLKECARPEGQALIIDLLDVEDIKVGNRYKEYAMFPEQNISLRMFWGRDRENVVFSCGHSILNKTSTINVGALMLKYGGGGHTRVGTCQVPEDRWQDVRDEMVEILKNTAVPAW